MKRVLVIISVLLLFPGCGKELVQPGREEEREVYKKVDLGLSVLWADCNVGAAVFSDLGDTYSWGETTAPIGYDAEGVKWDKYYLDEVYHTTDHKTALEECDDVAHLTAGGKWRIPSKNEMEELVATRNNPDYQWWYANGENAPYCGWSITYLVNGNSIFLPTGWHGDDPFLYLRGYYWSSTGYKEDMNYAWYFDFDKNFMSVPRGHRSIKMAVRPVWGDRVAVTGIALDRSSSTLALTSTPDMFSDVLLSATVYPQDAFEKGVAWSSSNPGVAWVFDGHVVAVSKGTTTITATSTDGGFTATCEVLVK